MSETKLAVMEKPKQTGMVRVGEQTLKPDKVIEAALASGYYKHVKSAADGYIIAAYGASLGMDLVTALSSIILINGRMTFTAGFIASLVKKSPKYRYKLKEKTDKKCSIEFLEKIEHCTKEGVKYWEWETQGVETFTIDMAKRANLVGKGPNWTAWPEAMLFARAMTAGVRTYCPDLLSGNSAYTPDELDPSIRMVPNADGDLVPDAEYVEAVPVQVSPPKLDTGLVADVRKLLKDTNSEEKQFLTTLCSKDNAEKLTQKEAEKAIRILQSKQANRPEPF